MSSYFDLYDHYNKANTLSGGDLYDSNTPEIRYVDLKSLFSKHNIYRALELEDPEVFKYRRLSENIVHLARQYNMRDGYYKSAYFDIEKERIKDELYRYTGKTTEAIIDCISKSLELGERYYQMRFNSAILLETTFRHSNLNNIEQETINILKRMSAHFNNSFKIAGKSFNKELFGQEIEFMIEMPNSGGEIGFVYADEAAYYTEVRTISGSFSVGMRDRSLHSRFDKVYIYSDIEKPKDIVSIMDKVTPEALECIVFNMNLFD